MRDYGTATWEGGKDGCDHKGGRDNSEHHGNIGQRNEHGDAFRNSSRYVEQGNVGGSLCPKCGAKRIDNQLGLEKTPEEYVENTVKWAREVWRVLRKDGCFWLNLGDSYVSNPSGKGEEFDNNFRCDERKTLNKTHQGAMTRRPNNLKPKDLCEIPSDVVRALRKDGWWLRSRLPWVKRCLSGGIMMHAWTQKGVIPTNLKDLYRLKPQTVKLWNGERWTQLNGMTKQPRKGNEIEIFLRSGERISCTPEHRWPVGDYLKYTSQLKVGDTLKRCRPASPNKPINHLPSYLIGRFVGLYIAEGCRDNSIIRIAGHKNENGRRIFLRDIADKYDGTMVIQDREGNGQNINLSGRVLFGILDDYVAGKGAHGKHLTTKAWQRGNRFLEDVLLGYLEGDGSYEEQNDRWRLGFCNNDTWVSDLRSICARLGISLRLKRTIHKNQTGKFKGYKGEIRFDLSDKSINSGNFKKLSDNEILRIGKPRARYYYDVEVEDEPHLFSLASGILTHNSAMPESCTDRPASALEYMFLLTKSGMSQYWTNPRLSGTRQQPKPDYIWKHQETGEQLDVDPQDDENFKRINLWQGHDYYFDMEAIRINYSNINEMEYRAKLRAGRTYDPDTPHKGQCMDFEVKSGRNFRNTDLFYQSLEEPHGAIFCGDEMVGLDVNPQAYKEAHFATFPEKLVEPLIKAGSSERGACSECGAPWERVVEKSGGTTGKSWHDHTEDLTHGQRDTDRNMANGYESDYRIKTIGWQPTCKCGHKETVPCIVLDPFGGSGTTKNVADRLGRRGLICELKMEYIEMAKKRCRQEPGLF